ncbi:hypothetical protein MVEG_09390 [Podila verticillata NRRL 6337]|nr:hypothetical protein MVEG_09390 [Podila verticillata NRRL 6337]
MPSSPRPRTSATRFAIGKAILLVGVSFATLALVHLNLSVNLHHRNLGPTELEEQKQLYQELQQQQKEQEQQQQQQQQQHYHQYQPPSSQQQHGGQNNTATPLTPPSQTTPGPFATFTILAETDLTRTVQYDDGVQHKIFKDQFFKHPEAAKQEMGSFLDRLATRSWWNVVPTGSQSDDEEQGGDDGEEGGDDEDHLSLMAKAPGRFFTYLPLGGGNNQFTALQKAALLAKDMNRTLLLPPISPNQHVKTWAGPAYSEFYNLDQFIRLSGIYVLEWHAIKQTPSDPPKSLTRHWEDFSEELVCIPNGGVGLSNQSLFDRFRPQFLLKYRPHIPREDVTYGKSTDYAYAKNVLLKDEVDVGASGPSPLPELLKCLSCPYFLGGGGLGSRLWSEVGVHLRFNTRIEAMVDDILDTLLSSATKGRGGGESVSRIPFRPHPEFIIVHLRRGDIVKKCPAGVAEVDCVVQIETIAEKVDEIEKKRRIKALKGAEKDKVARLPVLVATNEKRVEELDKIEKLGWILLDHGDKSEDEDKEEGSATNMRKLGTFAKYGPWYPPMLDAVLLTRGNYMIGMKSSRMSALAGQRGHAWYGHETMLL